MRRQFLVPSYVPLLLLLLGAWMLRPSHSADPRKPHPHKGLLEVRTHRHIVTHGRKAGSLTEGRTHPM